MLAWTIYSSFIGVALLLMLPREQVRLALVGLAEVERLEERPAADGVCSFVAFARGHGDAARSAIAQSVVNHGWSLLEIKPVALSLEDLFIRLVTKEEDTKEGAKVDHV